MERQRLPSATRGCPEGALGWAPQGWVVALQRGREAAQQSHHPSATPPAPPAPATLDPSSPTATPNA